MSGDAAAVDVVRIRIDEDSCIAGGQCEYLEPDMFEVDDDIGVASVTGDGLLPRDRALKLVDRCPGQAIHIVEHEGD